jgi:cell division protein ZapB
MSSQDLDALERKIDDLLRLCTRLGRENRALRSQQHAWTVERARLIEKNELAKQRVEAMISRLKALESDS